MTPTAQPASATRNELAAAFLRATGASVSSGRGAQERDDPRRLRRDEALEAAEFAPPWTASILSAERQQLPAARDADRRAAADEQTQAARAANDFRQAFREAQQRSNDPANRAPASAASRSAPARDSDPPAQPDHATVADNSAAADTADTAAMMSDQPLDNGSSPDAAAGTMDTPGTSAPGDSSSRRSSDTAPTVTRAVGHPAAAVSIESPALAVRGASALSSPANNAAGHDSARGAAHRSAPPMIDAATPVAPFSVAAASSNATTSAGPNALQAGAGALQAGASAWPARSQTGGSATNSVAHDAPDTREIMQANIERMLRAVRAQVNDEESSAIVRLDPPELGAIRLNLSMHRDELTLVMETQSALAHELLRDQLDTLRRGLEAGDIRLESVTLQPLPEAPSNAPATSDERGAAGALADSGSDARAHDERAAHARDGSTGTRSGGAGVIDAGAQRGPPSAEWRDERLAGENAPGTWPGLNLWA